MGVDFTDFVDEARAMIRDANEALSWLGLVFQCVIALPEPADQCAYRRLVLEWGMKEAKP